ncbi:DUF3265 domain-containing protein [Vibrio splendidus]|uniref:DUF3265 domain-containing protein n=1 Tax=Vibrio splendidus TaxID=29497 RepID=A0ABD5A6P3_VIBSP|nr:DUF3265 domain-containing protein [Vibrio splendidus]MCC4881945.1 DUF3265 domain-containing protein [Vibrio splendidus]MDP2488759.1 DUF3265 domain-containing protein [Vibrio splendidus]PTO82766.1 DUF3265 domain-containing protein [Vibrio splendidus]PTP64055.1 DUF3265 domain-containing protein [Vibrio splendidus]
MYLAICLRGSANAWHFQFQLSLVFKMRYFGLSVALSTT